MDVGGFKILKFLNKQDRKNLAKGFNFTNYNDYKLANKFCEPKVTTFDIWGMMVSAVTKTK